MYDLDIFTYENLYNSALKCSCGVKWKTSVAHYILNIESETAKLYNELHNGTYKEKRHKIFKVYEPKEREVLSICFRDRVVQRTFCDLLVYPIMTRSFIYDNCACQKGKGTDFARERLTKHLRSFYQRHKSNEGYIIHIDIKKYYPSMRHDKAEELLKEKLPPKAYETAKAMLSMYPGERGFSAGSQLIQILGVAMLDRLDHYIKERLKVKEYVRYMDDLILIVKDNPNRYIETIEEQINELGFEINKAKTRTAKLRKGDTFLGFDYSLSDSGKVYKALNIRTLKRMRRKLKNVKYANKEQLDEAYQTWRSYAARGCNKKKLKEIEKIYQQRREQI